MRRRAAFWAFLIVALVGGVFVAVGERTPATVPTQTITGNELGRLPDGPMPGVGTPPANPRITGNNAADLRIREVATARGYRLRGDPLDPMGSYQGRRLQQRAIDDLVELQQAMQADIGATLTLTSAHRSQSRQRQLFLAQLAVSSIAVRGRSVSNAEIAAGSVDDVLDHAMRIAAPPGFSRHHTGLVIDVRSGGLASFAFADSAAYEWLSDDNFAQAMAYGWVPSYPPGSSDLGPNPEPWEWAWIGRGAAACARERTCATGALDRANDDGIVGWAVTPAGLSPERFRLVTGEGSEAFEPQPESRPDLGAVFGSSASALGFTADVGVNGGQRWACVEARAVAGAPWGRVGCLDLS